MQGKIRFVVFVDSKGNKQSIKRSSINLKYTCGRIKGYIFTSREKILVVTMQVQYDVIKDVTCVFFLGKEMWKVQ